jgi:hypothetical protein
LLLLSESEYFAASRCQTTQSGNVTSALTGEKRVNGVRKTATEDYNIPRITETYPIISPKSCSFEISGTMANIYLIDYSNCTSKNSVIQSKDIRKISSGH